MEALGPTVSVVQPAASPRVPGQDAAGRMPPVSQPGSTREGAVDRPEGRVAPTQGHLEVAEQIDQAVDWGRKKGPKEPSYAHAVRAQSGDCGPGPSSQHTATAGAGSGHHNRDRAHGSAFAASLKLQQT